MRKIVLSGAFAALAIYAVAATAYGFHARSSAIRGWAAVNEATGTEREKLAFRASLRLNADIKPSDTEREIVDKITNLLYQRANFGGNYKNTYNDALRYVWNMHGANREYCSTLSATLVWALHLFDIPARHIKLAARSFITGKELGDTHVLVETRAGGKTYLIDPTFNVHYHCDGAHDIDAKTMNECVRAGRNLTWTYIAKPRTGRMLKDYYIPIQKLAQNIDASADAELFYSYEYPSKGWFERARAQYNQSLSFGR